MQILQITDLHLYGNAGGSLRGVETDSSLRSVLEDAASAGEAVPGVATTGAPTSGPTARGGAASAPVEAFDYSAILVTGDLVQDDPSGYLRFKSLLGSQRKPVLCIPGNHDEPDAMRHSLRQEPFHYCGAHIIDDWHFVMLDSYDPGHVGGRLTASELERLDAALTKSPAHALVCLHHHPVAMGSRWLDTIGLVNADEFWRVIDAHPHVRGVVWGHVHQVYDGERNGVQLFATPSTGAQF
ncbi:MAG: 3,5-cyclic-AMP phosphodiesterase, partial [Gammaproteobacteria bacterium]|nr:3,5-cyclic-AMP phosphodiesterase [Gammaproteobacteria bacterium]